MKKYIAVFLLAVLTLTLISCAKEESASAESAQETSSQRAITCSIGYPTLLEDGGIQLSACMEDYTATTMEQALKEGLNGKTEVTFDDEGNIASIGGITPTGNDRFAIRTIASNGQPTILTDKPADIALEDFVSYEIYYADENGVQINNINS